VSPGPSAGAYKVSDPNGFFKEYLLESHEALDRMEHDLIETTGRGNEKEYMKPLTACRWKVLAALTFLVLATVQPTLGNEVSEYQVKAAFLFNFAKFVQWPVSAFSKEEDPIVIGILGSDPFGKDLDSVVVGKTVNGRSFLVKRLAGSNAEAKKCHILFISKSEKNNLATVLGALGGTPVLTVSEIDQFIQQGGIIKFNTEGGRVMIAINESAAKTAQIAISSRLMQVAKGRK
jgi:hypothetical protein